MSDRLRIGDSGELEACPRHPLCSGVCGVDHVQSRHLFKPEAFEQIAGQIALEQAMGDAFDGPGGFWENRERNL